MKDFTHIAYLGGPPPALVVTASFPAKTLPEYLEISRKRPEGIAYASSGFGTHVHLMAELFKSLTGTNMLHVPYNGGGPAVADLIAGHVPSAMVSFGSVASNVRSGKVRVLAVASPQRLKDYPDVPTFDPDQFTAFFRSEIARWSPIAKKIAESREKGQKK
jgi:tripartite-type tricarboxylate transporter receptor subunit TctC